MKLNIFLIKCLTFLRKNSILYIRHREVIVEKAIRNRINKIQFYIDSFEHFCKIHELVYNIKSKEQITDDHLIEIQKEFK